jgi:hypothetical protein
MAVQGLRSKMSGALPEGRILSILLWGGSIALIVDHLVNGELLLFSGNLLWDLTVGCAMTGAIFLVWGLYVGIGRSLAKASRVLRT